MRDLTGQNTGNYRIAVQSLASPVGCTALTFGAAPTQKVITVAGEVDCFSFTGANLDDIRIRIVNTAGAIAPVTEVVRTDGTTQCGHQQRRRPDLRAGLGRQPPDLGQ